MSWIPRLIINAAAVLITDYLLSGIHVDDFITAILVAISLAVLNWIVKPILIIITIPITILSLGLFLLVINAIIILLADSMVDGFQVDGFWWALLFSFVMAIINSLLGNSNNNYKNKKRKDEV